MQDLDKSPWISVNVAQDFLIFFHQVNRALLNQTGTWHIVELAIDGYRLLSRHVLHLLDSFQDDFSHIEELVVENELPFFHLRQIKQIIN